MVRMTRSISGLPLGLDQMVKICLRSKAEQGRMNCLEVGWKLSEIKNSSCLSVSLTPLGKRVLPDWLRVVSQSSALD